jgi:hypothetical protein
MYVKKFSAFFSSPKRGLGCVFVYFARQEKIFTRLKYFLRALIKCADAGTGEGMGKGALKGGNRLGAQRAKRRQMLFASI